MQIIRRNDINIEKRTMWSCVHKLYLIIVYCRGDVTKYVIFKSEHLENVVPTYELKIMAFFVAGSSQNESMIIRTNIDKTNSLR